MGDNIKSIRGIKIEVLESSEESGVFQNKEKLERVESRKRFEEFESSEESKKAKGKGKVEEEMPSKRRFKIIGVLGDDSLGKYTGFMNESIELGIELTRRGITLMYGGGIGGLRGNAALSANIRKGKVVSVLVNGLDNYFCTIGSELVVMTLPERTGCFLYYADAFIAVPGGAETLDGIFSVAYWTQLNLHRKPLGLLNVNGFFDDLLSFLDQAVEQGFILKVVRNIILSAPTASELLDQMQSYEPESGFTLRQIGWQTSAGEKLRKMLSKDDEPGPDTTLRL